MAAQIMYGAPVAEQIERRVRAGVADFVRLHGVKPRMDIVQVGRGAASTRYVGKKIEACERAGMTAELHLFDDQVTGEELRGKVCGLSEDPAVHGILVQLPLPLAIEEPDAGATGKFEIFDAIAATKDIDGVSRHSVPPLYRADARRMMFLPCTPLAVLRMLSYYHIPTQGKVAVVVGRNDITAKPMHHLLGGRRCNATAVWCHRYTSKADHDHFMRQADIVVTSVGNPNYRVTGDLLKPGATVVDIGTRVDSDGRLHGDAEFESARQVASWITPVPKGVGPVTVAAVTENLLRAAEFCVGGRKPGFQLDL